MKNIETPTISVIVPVYNSESTLEKCLKAIRNSAFNDYELIVIDSCSSDKTVSIAKKYANKVISLDNTPQRAKARRMAAENAKGSIVVGVDSDIIIRRNTLSRITEYLNKHTDIDAVTGLLSIEHPNLDFFSQYKNLYMNFIFKKLPNTVTFLYGSIHAIRKEIIDLYDSDLGIGEDTAIGQQLTHYGKKISFLRNLEVTHLKKYNVFSFFKNNFLIPYNWAKLFKRYKGWKQIAKFKTGFAHSSKTQILSIALSPFILFALLVGAFNLGLPKSIYMLFGLWTLLNLQFFVFLLRAKGFVFLFKSVFITFIDNIVMGAGILCGLITVQKRS